MFTTIDIHKVLKNPVRPTLHSRQISSQNSGVPLRQNISGNPPNKKSNLFANQKMSCNVVKKKKSTNMFGVVNPEI